MPTEPTWEQKCRTAGCGLTIMGCLIILSIPLLLGVAGFIMSLFE